MPSSHLILCCPLLLLPPIPTSIRVFSNVSILCMRWPKYWSFSFSIIPSKEHSVQFSSVAQSCPTLCDAMNHSMPGLPVPHQLPDFIQTHVHRVGDAIQPSHPLSSSFPPAPNPSQHQSFPMNQLLAWGGQSAGVSALASFLPENTQGWSPSEWTGWISLQSKGLSRVK